MLGFISCWLTPTSLFLFLNLMIGTIIIMSRYHKKSQHEPENSQPLVRVPSFLDRVKSINLSLYKVPSSNLDTNYLFPEPEHHTNQVDPFPPPLTRAPSLLERVKSFNFSSLYSSSDPPNPEPEVDTEPELDLDQGQDQDHDHHMKRSKSETKPGPEIVPEKMKKSASEKSVRRIEKTASFGEGGDHSVDAKADDFINRFKQHLKLQRLDSLLRSRG